MQQNGLPDQINASVNSRLNRAAAYLRGQLGRAVRLKYLPALNFVHDGSFDEASRIEAIIHRPEVARDLAADDAGAATDEPDS